MLNNLDETAYRGSPDWLKMKNPEAPAVKREAKRTGDGKVAAPMSEEEEVEQMLPTWTAAISSPCGNLL